MVSVIILNYNGRDNLKNCLESIYKHESGLEKEIIVVDNGSSDGSRDMLKKLYPEIKLIENTINQGCSKARNQAIRASNGEYILFLDSDAYFTRPVTDTLKKFLDTHADVGMIGPKVLNPNQTLQRTCFSYPTLLKSFVEVSLAYLILESLEKTKLRNLIYRIACLLKPFLKSNMFTFGNYAQATDCDWISSACCMIRRQPLKEVDLLDGKFFAYFEEMDLCRRVRKKGYKVIYYPLISVIHAFHSSLKKDLVFFSMQRFHSLHYFYKKHYTKKKLLLFKYVCIPAALSGIILYPLIKLMGLNCNFKSFLSSRLEILNTLFPSRKRLLKKPFSHPCHPRESGDPEYDNGFPPEFTPYYDTGRE